MNKFVFVFLVLPLMFFSYSFGGAKKHPVREGVAALAVFVEVPLPTEMVDESAARKVAQEAAVQAGQNLLLQHIRSKKAKSGKTLATSEIASLSLQNELKAYVQKGKPTDIQFSSKKCSLRLVLPKKELRLILRKN